MQSETLIFLYSFPVWRSPRPFSGSGQNWKEACVEAVTTGREAVGDMPKLKTVSSSPFSKPSKPCSVESWRHPRLNSSPDRPMFTQFSLLPHQPGLLANVLYSNLGDASWGRTSSLSPNRCLQCFPSIQTALFSIHWSPRQTSCSDVGNSISENSPLAQQVSAINLTCK